MGRAHDGRLLAETVEHFAPGFAGLRRVVIGHHAELRSWISTITKAQGWHPMARDVYDGRNLIRQKCSGSRRKLNENFSRHGADWLLDNPAPWSKLPSHPCRTRRLQ